MCGTCTNNINKMKCEIISSKLSIYGQIRIQSIHFIFTVSLSRCCYLYDPIICNRYVCVITGRGIFGRGEDHYYFIQLMIIDCSDMI